MLAQLAHKMTVPFNTRRAAQAAAVTLSLIGGAADAPARAETAYVSVRVPGFRLFATRCDPPLLIDDASAAAVAAGVDVLVLRFSPACGASSPVTFDWLPARSARCSQRMCLLPALPRGGGLSLVPKHSSDVRLDVSRAVIAERTDLPTSWPPERDLAVARAVAVFKAELGLGA